MWDTRTCARCHCLSLGHHTCTHTHTHCQEQSAAASCSHHSMMALRGTSMSLPIMRRSGLGVAAGAVERLPTRLLVVDFDLEIDRTVDSDAWRGCEREGERGRKRRKIARAPWRRIAAAKVASEWTAATVWQSAPATSSSLRGSPSPPCRPCPT